MNNTKIFQKIKLVNFLIKNTSSKRFSSIRTFINYQKANNFDEEVEHHNKLASQWWEKSGPMKGLHSLNEIRVPFIRDGLIASNSKIIKENKSKILDGFEILEIGCGGGILSENLANLHANVTGIDLGEDLISIAQKHSTGLNPDVQNRLSYKVESIKVHANNNESKYDAIVLSEVIEHIDNKIEMITSCVQALKTGGSIFITTPNKTFLSLLCVIGFTEYVANMVPKGTHTYDKFISPLDMQRILDSLNCNTIVINGMFYDILSNKWMWTASTAFCYALQAIKTE